MKIVKIELFEVKIPLTAPFKTALRTVDLVHDVIVKITAEDGSVGFGEAPPTAVITGETIGSIRCAIETVIGPTLVGMDIFDLDGMMYRLHHCIQKNTSAKAAVDIALYDLYGKAMKKPLYQILGGNKKSIETDITISVNPIEEMINDSLKAVEDGFRILKLKVGKGGQEDITRITEIRKAVGAEIALRVDANQGWSAKESVKIISTLEDKGVILDLVEQPVAAHDFKGMQYVTKHVYTKILADESVFTAEDAINIIQNRAADLINIKLMKTGGIYEALKICTIAEIYDVECMIGCMLESKISVSAAAHLAAGKRVITRTDLDGPILCKFDPYEGGPIFNGRNIDMVEAHGIGITSIEQAIEIAK